MTHYHVYAKTDCGFCKKTIDLLDSRGDKMVLVLLDKAPDDVVSAIKQQFDHNTVPIILEVNENNIRKIGGHRELAASFEKEVEDTPFSELSPEEQDADSMFWDHGHGD